MRDDIKWIVILMAVGILLSVLVAMVSAEDVTIEEYVNESTVIVEVPTPDPTPTPERIPNGPHINQGDTVYAGDCVDISGVVPPYENVAYWDGFDMYDSEPSYTIPMPDLKREYFHFCIDDRFAGYYGRWYKYDGIYEQQGNNLAFVVRPLAMKNSTMTFPNGTVINQTQTINETYIEKPIKPEPLLPERHINDYVLAKGDNLTWSNGSYHIWIFGSTEGIYDQRGGFIPSEQIEALSNGDYTLAIQTPGYNTIYEASYKNDTLIPGLYGEKPVSVFGQNPANILSKLKEMLQSSDDKLYEYQISIDIPSITINRVDEIYANGRAVLDVRGYTNTANGTKITVSLDEKDQKKWTSTTTAVRTSPGNMSYYRAYVPFDYDELAADARNHTLVARTELGGYSSKDFKVSVMPADSYKPNATLKYIEDRNPFIPTPTPEVIIETTVVVETVTVTIPVTPSQESVDAAQKKATEEVALSYVFTGATILVFLLVVAGLIWYGVKVWRRL